MGDAAPHGPGPTRSIGPWLILPWIVGMALRLAHLPGQILGGDEMHAVRAVLKMSLPEILTTYTKVDFCQPLTALYKLHLLAGGELTERTLRAPILLAAALFLVVAPCFAARLAGRETATVFAWALALSPGLIFYSRIARSYAPAGLLAFTAGMAFFAWWEDETARGRRRWGALYAASAALAMYFHLGTAPLAATPFAFAAVDLARRAATGDPSTARRLRSTLLLGISTLAAVAAFVLPALDSLRELVKIKSGGGGMPSARVVADALLLQAGTRFAGVAVLAGLLTLWGFAALARQRRSLALYTLALVAGQVLGLLVLAPFGMDRNPLIFNRYLLFATPLALWWLARGAVALGRLAPRGRTFAAVAPIVLLALAGPLPGTLLEPTSFQHHNLYLAWHRPRPHLTAESVADFYRAPPADGAREEGALLEAPWSTSWRWGHIFPLYQEHHHRDVYVAPDTPGILFDDGMALRRLVEPTLEAFLDSPARWLVVHRRPVEEERARAEEAGIRLIPTGPREAYLEHLQRTGERLHRQAAQAWGEPFYQDGWIAVWDLDAARSHR